jgi:hypothetical protein
MLRPGTAPGRTQVDWLEPELVSERIAELRKEEGALEDALAELLAVAFPRPPACEPGECFSYAHTNYAVISRASPR